MKTRVEQGPGEIQEPKIIPNYHSFPQDTDQSETAYLSQGNKLLA